MERKPRVLAAEDEPISAQLLKSVLRKHGVDVDLAHNGNEVVEMWEKGDYDLILMDVQMPHLDGFAATRLIREKEREGGRHIKIVAMTGTLDAEGPCRAAGMDEVLRKPLDLRSAAGIRELLKGK